MNDHETQRRWTDDDAESALRWRRCDDATDANHEQSHGDAAPLPAAIGRRLAEGLHQLLEAYQLAVDVDADVWEFALSLREMRGFGLTNADLRWMVLKNYVQPGCETTLPGESQRSFRPTPGVLFSKRSCFVLTAEGVEAARHAAVVRNSTPVQSAEHSSPAADNASPRPRVVPHWDADLQELRVNGLIVKQYKVPAPNQEMVLAAFEEEHWPARIDDPLPPQSDQDPKRRLHDTIVSLNRNHKHRMMRFMGDGSGEGVRWTIVTDADGDTE